MLIVKDLIKRTFIIWRKKIWINRMNREANRLEKYRIKYKVQLKLCEELYKMYEETFKENQ